MKSIDPVGAEKKLCLALFNQELVPSDTREDSDWMLKNQCFYFTQTDEAVMSRATIGHGPQPTGKFKWALEYTKVIPGGHWEPDDYDLVEHERYDTLLEAIKAGAILLKEWDVNNTAEAIGLEWQAQHEEQM